jgi:hypothetical protein
MPPKEGVERRGHPVRACACEKEIASSLAEWQTARGAVGEVLHEGGRIERDIRPLGARGA